MSQSRAPRRSWMLLLAIATVLGLALVGLTQCRPVSDSLTGVRITDGSLSGRSHCAHECNEAQKASHKAEKKRHRKALEACRHDHECREAEEATHRHNQREIERQKKHCKKNCYNEGGGTAGA